MREIALKMSYAYGECCQITKDIIKICQAGNNKLASHHARMYEVKFIIEGPIFFQIIDLETQI
jgi:hypothetical protein